MRPEFRTCLGALKRQRSPMRERISTKAASRFLAFLASLSLSLSLSRFSRVYFISDCCAKYFRQRGVPSLAPSLVDKRARLTGFSAFREFSPTSLRQALRNESGMSKSAWYSNYDYCIRRMQISSLVRSWRAYFLNRDRLKIG